MPNGKHFTQEEKAEMYIKRAKGELNSQYKPIAEKDRHKAMISRAQAGTLDNPNDNQKMVAHAVQIMSFPKIDTHDLDQVEQRTYEYLSLCAQNGMKPGIEGYALALGINRKSLFDIRTGRQKRPKEVVEIMERTCQLVGEIMENGITDGKINPLVGFFFMRNNHGYKNADPEEEPHTINEETKTAEQIAAKYADIPDD